MRVTVADDVTYDVFRWDGGLAPSVRRAWDDLAAVDHRAPLFNYREWCETAADCGAQRLWGGVIALRGTRPIGLFPLVRRTIRIWEVASFLGTGDLQILIDPADEAAAWQAFAYWVRAHAVVGMVKVGACGDAQRVALFFDACSQRHLVPTATPLEPPVVWNHLPANWDALIANLGAATRRDLRRAEQELTRDYPGITIEYVTDEAACLDALEHLIRLYRRRWGQRPGGCCFDNPRTVAFYRRIVAWAARQGYAVFSLMRLEGRPILVHAMYLLPAQQTLYQQFVSRDMSALAKRYRPGIVEAIRTTRWALEHGVRYINQGTGASPYKLLFAGIAQARWQLSIAGNALDAVVLPAVERSLHVIRRGPVHAAYHLRMLCQRNRSPVSMQHLFDH